MSHSAKPAKNTTKNFHPRSRHNHGYDFEKLLCSCPQLKTELISTLAGSVSIDFAKPKAVRLLNEALLKSEYGVKYWQLADNFLCPPIPGRVDYLHYLADLLASSYQTKVSKLSQRTIMGLDVGCGASLVYPLLGHKVYGWKFVGSDINPPSIKASEQLINANELSSAIAVRLQSEPKHIFKNVIQQGEFYDFTMCNPPFHKSADEAASGTRRKQHNLAKNKMKRHGDVSPQSAGLNFSGQHNELWCDGGESAFIRNMIFESQAYAQQCYWFTSLVAKKDNLPIIKKALKKAQVAQYKVINMTQGQKITRIICWTYFAPKADEFKCADFR